MVQDLNRFTSVFVEHFQDLLATSTTAFHAAAAGTGALQTITAALTQPDVPRNATVTTTNVAAPTGVSIVTGVDASGATTTDTITLVPGGTGTGVKAFATIISYTIPAGVTAADTVALGSGAVFGLSNRLARIIKVKNKTADVAAASYTANTSYNTLATSVSGGDDLTIWYMAI